MATTSTKKKPKPSKAPAEDSSAFGPIAERFRRAGDLDRAVSLCREGLQKYPDHVSARVTLGWALLELSRYDEARTELELVLRRRPDNLAAIRALAELHDRSEHTLNLPMDGPGQWPPSEEAVDAATAEAPVAAVEEPAAVAEAEPELIVSGHNHAIKAAAAEPAVMPPAEIGLAMWSAAPEPEARATAAIESPAQEPLPAEEFAAPFQAESVAASETDIAALLAEAESLEAAADAVKDDEVTPAATVLLEDDVDLGSLTVESAVIVELEPSYAEAAAAQAEAEAAAAAAAAAAQAEIEAAARAQAEAEEAAAAAAAQAQAEAEEAAAAAAAQAQAEAEEAAAAAAAQAQAEAEEAAAAAAALAQAELEAAAAAAAAAAAQAEIEAAARVQAEAEAEAAAAQAEADAAAAQAAAKAQAELEAAAAAAAAAAAQAEIEAAAAAQAAAEAAALAQAELEAAAAAEATALAEAEANAFKLVAPTLENFPEPVADLEEMFVAASVDPKLQPELIWNYTEVAEVAEVTEAKVVSIVRGPEPSKPSPLPKLERFLGQVQSRRRQLVAESVA